MNKEKNHETKAQRTQEREGTIEANHNEEQRGKRREEHPVWNQKERTEIRERGDKDDGRVRIVATFREDCEKERDEVDQVKKPVTHRERNGPRKRKT